MTEATFIIALENDLERIGVEHIIRQKLSDAVMLPVTTMHEVHKLLFENESAVVVLSSDFLEADGVSHSTALSKCFSHSKWLIIVENMDELFLIELIGLFKDASIVLNQNKEEEIARAITETFAGRKFYCSEAEALAVDICNRKKGGVAKRNLLTTTELELVHLIAQGKTAKDIAEQRCLSYHTVNTHRKNIFRKLEINSVQELIKYALRNGLVDLTEYYI